MKHLRIFLIALFVVLAPMLVISQYFSELVPFGPYSPNPIELNLLGDEYLISVLNKLDGINSGISLVKFDATADQVTRADFFNQKADYESVEIVEDAVYVLGRETEFVNNRIRVQKLDDKLNTIWNTYSNVSSELPYVYAGTYLDGHLYLGSADRINPNQTSTNFKWEATIHKFDTLGNEVWRKNYGQDGNYAAITTVEPHQDEEHLMVSMLHSEVGPLTNSAWLMKLDQSGDVVWRYESSERPSSGADKIRIAQLSDGRYIVLHTLDKGQDNSYFLNGWSPYPYQFHWIDDDGSVVKKYLKKYDRIDQLIYRNIKSGNGDYFFAYGSYRFHGPGAIRDTTYAHLTKFSNEGDTIWTKLYHHPDYALPDTRMIMNDIVEDENGDITCLVNIDLVTEPNKIWLFKVGESGCPDGKADCPERNIVYRNTTSTQQPTSERPEISIYPNPHHESFTVSSTKEIVEINIYDIQGRLIENIKPYAEEYRLITSNYKSGVFLLESIDEVGSKSIRKIIKQ